LRQTKCNLAISHAISLIAQKVTARNGPFDGQKKTSAYHQICTRHCPGVIKYSVGSIRAPYIAYSQLIFVLFTPATRPVGRDMSGDATTNICATRTTDDAPATIARPQPSCACTPHTAQFRIRPPFLGSTLRSPVSAPAAPGAARAPPGSREQEGEERARTELPPIRGENNACCQRASYNTVSGR
jgi:hypothetical protein